MINSVKIFYAPTVESLEVKINNYFEKNSRSLRILNVSLTCDNYNSRWVAAVTYTVTFRNL